jgi:PKD repeat protein
VTRRRTGFDAPTEPGNRRPGIVPGRRLALSLAICCGMLASPPAVAVADNGSSALVNATVYGAGGRTTTDSVSAGALETAPQRCPVYGRRSMDELGRQGPVTVTLTQSTWTLATILGCLDTPIPVSAVTGVVVLRADGSPETSAASQLTPSDLAASSDFQNSAESAVIGDEGTIGQYDRPQRNAGDLDFTDEVQGGSIDIEVFEGPPLHVTASASATTVTQGATVTFSAAVTGNSTGSPEQYDWTFGGGAAPQTVAQPQVQFNDPGVYSVAAQVSDGDGGEGGDTLTVTVNPASPASTTTPTGTHTTGPTTSAGTTPGATPGGKKNGTTSPGTKGHHGRGSNTTSKPPKRKTSSHHRQPTTHTTAGNTGSGTGASGSGSSGGGSSGSAGTSGRGPPATATTPAPATPKTKAPAAPIQRSNPAPPPPASSGPLVSGRLISDVIALPAGVSPLVHVVAAPSATAPARQSPRQPSALPIVGAALAVVLLFGLGAGRELRGPRRRRVIPIGA